jgi:3-oxoacyl-[acyl-carrier-protein] synthase II
LGVAGFNSARAISTRNDEPTTASRPFDATRDGFVLSEGSAALVLEDYEFAISRGAPILAELIGYGSSGDAFHVTQPPETGEGAALAMAAALRRAEVAPSDIDYVNMHGTSTSAGDIAETAAVRSVFGEAANTLALSSTKSQLGHMLGAAGTIEMIMCVLALQHSIIPPTMNLHTPDPKCDLDYVPHTPRPASLSIVVNNSFGFGGHNASLVLKKYEA